MQSEQRAHSKRLQRGLLLAASLGLWSCTLSAAERPATPATLASAASIDGACPWGRLGEGHGRLVRCLTQGESERLRSETGTAGAPATTPTASGDVAPLGSAPPRSPALVNTVPAEPGETPVAPPATPPAAPVVPEETFVAEIGLVEADKGTFPDAARSLKKARERFAECVEKNGGLSAERGEVELRFLVQGRGRAEGVSVKKHRGVSEAAAKCVADVLDRRYVGSPEEPMVAATLQVVISKKKR